MAASRRRSMEPYDILIIGAGPVGIACGVEAARQGLSHVIVEKGCLLNTLKSWPTHTVFFSTPELLEVGRVPFVCQGPKPTRREGLVYYRKVAERYGLNLRLYERVLGVDRQEGGFLVRSERGTYACRKLVVSTGFYDNPNLLGVPGEDLPKVSHYYTEPFAYSGTDVLVVGGKNSAVEAALDLHRNGARVTMAVRRPELGASVKYWLRPDVENRIAEGAIRAHFEATVESIAERTVTLVKKGQRVVLRNDFVLLLTGFHPDFTFLGSLGVEITPDGHLVHDEATQETTVSGLYLAGVVAAGVDIGRLFIENGRLHAETIVRDVLTKLGRPQLHPIHASRLRAFQDGD